MIETIQPQIFGDSIRAFFTLKNAQLNEENQSIKGLNLGFNTGETPEIIEEKRRKLLAEFDIDHNWIAFANQVHSNRVKEVIEGGTFAGTDALITRIPGLALAIQVADCAAVLIADSQQKMIAAIHAGWRGASGDIVPRTLQKMQELGAKEENCKAFISPCISLENFEVGREVAEQFPARFVDYENYTKPHINLKNFLKNQLKETGVLPENIEVNPACTIEENERFYSYRREKEQSGRMMAVIQMKMPDQ